MAQPAARFGVSTRDIIYEEIVDSLEKLPEALRAVFVSSHYQGKSNRQIATELGVPDEVVERLLEDANHIFYRSLHRFHFDS
jgi:RNA polymerase sigma factor (sigma-70 family)